jgi:hypothetical protein
MESLQTWTMNNFVFEELFPALVIVIAKNGVSVAASWVKTIALRTNMKLNLISIGLSLAVAAALDGSTLSSDAQDVAVTGTLTDVQGTGSTFDYTLTLDNTGTEAVQSLWVGWVPGSFNIDAPTSVGNNLGWSSTVDGNSIQYGGTAGSALAAG